MAEQARVSVGTLYQYFSHKQALLFAIVERHFDLIEGAMRTACDRLHGCELAIMPEGLATAWLDAKTADIVASRGIYGIAAEFDLSGQMGRAATLMGEAFETLLTRAPGVRFRDPPAAAFMLAALLGGSVRVVLEADPSGHSLERLRSELPRACHAYLISASEPV